MRPIQLTCVLLLFSALLYPAQDPPRSSGWAVIPVPEYKALHDKAYPSEPQPEPPPVEATLTRVEYDLRVPNGDVAEGQARLTVDVLKDGWVRLPIPPGLMVREARLDGKLVALTNASSGKTAGQCALLSKQGRAVLQLDVGFRISSSAGEETLTLPAGGSGIIRASIALPRQDVDLRLVGGFLASKSESQAETKWVVYGHGSGPLVLTWRKKIEDRHVTLPLRLRGSLTELVGLGEDSTAIYAEVKLEVLQGEAREVRVQLPPAVTVNQVLGATVADWEMKEGKLNVTFLDPIQDGATFAISGEARLPRDGAIEIPLLQLMETERDNGGVAVEVLGAGEIKDLKTQGLEKTEASELGSVIADREAPSMVAFRFRPASGRPRTLGLDVVRYAQQAVLTANIEEARYRALMTSEGKTLVEARYAVRNNQRNFVKIGLPAGAVLWSASRSGQAVRPGQAPDGSLLFPLAKSRAGEDAPAFVVELLYVARGTAWGDKGQAKLALPLIDLPVSRTGLSLYYPPQFRVTAEPGSFHGHAYSEPGSAALRGEGGHTPADERRGSTASRSGRSDSSAQIALESLASNYRKQSESRKAGASTPAGISFPVLGPSVFLVSELTGEGQGPFVDLSYQRVKNGGVK